MQVSFLKDLVTLRTPSSSYTFLNYLGERGRLSDFINLKTFFPTRVEFHDYLSWAAARVSVPIEYGSTARRIEWRNGSFEVEVESYQSAAASPTRRTIYARNVVLGLGIEPVLPKNVTPSNRVFHNHRLLGVLKNVPPQTHGKFVVVGSGQSAAEIAAYLHERSPSAEVHISHRRFGYSPSDDTPYVNRIFDPDSVDHFFQAPADVKRQLLEYHWLTNYSAVDADLIGELYGREYQERVQGHQRIFVHRVTELHALEEDAGGVTVVLRNLADESYVRIEADAVVLATGFRPRSVRDVLGGSVSAQFSGDNPKVERNYRLCVEENVAGAIYLNGGVEHSHGLSSSLLSNVAVRAADILDSIKAGLHARRF
ncbi:L-ornithine N5-oxygenase [Brevibacterium sp. Mu109]|nr:L-ornithine N5-oxygenase [Brevibacterium sp. Mu109]